MAMAMATAGPQYTIYDIFMMMAQKWYSEGYGVYTLMEDGSYLLYLGNVDNPSQDPVLNVGDIGHTTVYANNLDYYNHLHLQIGFGPSFDKSTSDPDTAGIVTQKIQDGESSSKNLCIMTAILKHFNDGMVLSEYDNDINTIIKGFVDYIYAKSGYNRFTSPKTEQDYFQKKLDFFVELSEILYADPFTYNPPVCQPYQEGFLEKSVGFVRSISINDPAKQNNYRTQISIPPGMAFSKTYGFVNTKTKTTPGGVKVQSRRLSEGALGHSKQMKTKKVVKKMMEKGKEERKAKQILRQKEAEEKAAKIAAKRDSALSPQLLSTIPEDSQPVELVPQPVELSEEEQLREQLLKKRGLKKGGGGKIKKQSKKSKKSNSKKTKKANKSKKTKKANKSKN